MTLHPLPEWEIPEQTATIARASFPKGNMYMKMYEELGVLYTDTEFAELYLGKCGQSAMSPGKLALITVMQFAEGLSDRQAADAVRSRIDWKYALGLELTDPGFDCSVLSEFRSRLCEYELTNKLLDVMLLRFQEKKLIKHRGKQRTDSTQVIAAIRQLNRLELVGETLRAALNSIASVAPSWLRAIISEDWFERYSWRFDNYRLPKNKNDREELALKIGFDGHYLLQHIWFGSLDRWNLSELDSVQTLRKIWMQQYTFDQDGLIWRKPEQTGLPPNSICIESPYDIEARNSSKREINWTGYKVHLSETCDESTPNIITHVETTAATTPDGEITSMIHHKLAIKNLLPQEHYVDAAYVDAYQLVESHQVHQISLIGPVAIDTSWQAKLKTGFDVSAFVIDWDEKVAICPQGNSSRLWRKARDCNYNPLIEIIFDRKTCAVCPLRNLCTSSATAARKIKLRPREQFEALQQRRHQQQTPEFEQNYARRAGVEGTISQGVGRFDLRRTRYFGLAKTHLQHIATACAINLSRFFAWSNHIPQARTRTSSFASLLVNCA
ncbi:DDE transposase [Nostoc sp. T09]|uniref:IS1182 family transposase n=1 Tax=Nostoc sp. T09 TaxID=1932621 RepID=UPI000A363480|nr:IS1182 family transposase [Nostoc sp. T09]OUL36096.1 DDE transposase [Nostoc sp. T09]